MENRRPSGSFFRRREETRDQNDTPIREERGGERNNFERGARRPYGERKEGGGFRQSDRPSRPYGERREGGGFRQSDRPNRPYGERREGGGFRQSDRPSRPYGERREGGEFRQSDRPNRPYGERREGGGEFRQSDRPRRPFGERSESGNSFDRPRRSFNPNFTRENRVAGGNRDSYGSNRSFSEQYEDNGRRGIKREGGSRFHEGESSAKFENRRNDRPRRDFGSDSRGGFERRDRFDRDKKFDRPDRFERAPQRPQNSPEEPETPNFTNVMSELRKGDIRLNRYVAMSGVCSRREADAMIQAGRVTVNGEVVTELGTKVDHKCEVMFDGTLICGERSVYIIMNKPKEYVTTLEDKNCKYIVTDLLEGQIQERVYPVGRLDKNSMGVLILTNDGELTKILTHPSYNKKKIYHAYIDKDITEMDMQKLAEGVELEDGISFVDEISCVDGNRREVGVEIHSGKNRIVRRLFEAVGYKVRKLDRVYFAGLTKKGLQRGEWRHLTPQEVASLKK